MSSELVLLQGWLDLGFSDLLPVASKARYLPYSQWSTALQSGCEKEGVYQTDSFVCLRVRVLGGQGRGSLHHKQYVHQQKSHRAAHSNQE